MRLLRGRSRDHASGLELSAVLEPSPRILLPDARREPHPRHVPLHCTSMCLVATSSVRLLTAFANEYNVELCHFNVDQAFVRADLYEDVFKRLPE